MLKVVAGSHHCHAHRGASLAVGVNLLATPVALRKWGLPFRLLSRWQWGVGAIRRLFLMAFSRKKDFFMKDSRRPKDSIMAFL